MENIGALSILIAFCLAVFAVVAAVTGKYARRPFLVISAERAVYSIWVLLTIAAVVLVASLLNGDYRMAYVVAHSNRAMSIIYKITAWWGGQEGSLLFWSWILSSYSAVVVYTNRRKFRDMMPIVVAILMTTLAFFVGMISFVASPFQVLMAGRGVIQAPDGNGLSPLSAVVDNGHSSSDAVSRLCRLHCAICFCHGFADHEAAGRRLDPYDAPLGNRYLAIPKYWCLARYVLGIYGARMGWLLGLGPGRERFIDALDYGYGFSAFGDDAGKKGNDEGLEYGARVGHIPAQHSRNYADTHWIGRFRARLRAISCEALFHDVCDCRHCADRLRDHP